MEDYGSEYQNKNKVNEKAFLSLLQHMPSAYISATFNAEEMPVKGFVVKETNHSFCNLVKKSTSDIVGNDMVDLLPDINQNWRNVLTRVIVNNKLNH